MTIEMAIDLLQSLTVVSFTLVAPILIAAIVVGVGVSLIQTVTSIQEQTLVFVPKLLATGMMVILAGNWMLLTIVEYSIQTIAKISEMGP